MSDAEINRAEHAAAIAEFNEKAALRYIATLEARVAELSETWTDEHGVTWAPPTAWAYAQSCRVRNELRVRIAKLEAAVRGSLIQNSGEGEWADVRRDGQRSQLAATIDAMEATLLETVEAS